jgi:hypothetical protein
VVNADGFGVGWYADSDPRPARYRRARPIWSDPSFADLARVTRSRAVLAAVRSATEDTETGEAAAAPYAADRWLFSHNGSLSGWPESGAILAAGLPPGDVLALEARCDSAVIWAVVLRRLREGCGPADALAATVRELDARRLAGRFNFLLTDGDALLLGTDLVKDPAVLVAAYDDAAGVTAAFNKNILSVLNAELGADFDLDAFDYVALWDPADEWIEMRLRSAQRQQVRLPAIGLTVGFAEGEEMRTEISAKFRRDGVRAELAAAGLAMRSWWTDDEGRFGLSLSVPF